MKRWLLISAALAALVLLAWACVATHREVIEQMSDLGYLISHIFVYLLIAALIGAIVGWLLRQWTYSEAAAANRASSPPSNPRSSSVSGPVYATAASSNGPDGVYSVNEIEGIGRVIGDRLRSTNLNTTYDLLDQCQDRQRRAEAAAIAKVDEDVLAQWVCAADLLRIPGVDGQFAELLESAGIRSVQSLAVEDAGKLHENLRHINETQRRVPQLPELDDVAAWIAAARELPRVLTESH